MLALLAAVVVIDQAAKWSAWRHVTGVSINPGGDFLTGPTVGSWYADPLAGALLDLVDFGLVSTAAAILARQRHLAVTVCGSLMVAACPRSSRTAAAISHLGPACRKEPVRTRIRR